MVNETSRILSIIAYYLSEYDSKAIAELGYKNATQAFKSISMLYGRDNNYLKLRRDEFDALPESSSSRKGWRNRPANNYVIELATNLKRFSFEELTDFVKSLLFDKINNETMASSSGNKYEVDFNKNSELDLEGLINFKDDTADITIKVSESKVRVYNRKLIIGLKKLYGGKCQLCNSLPLEHKGVNICEAHHIEYFSKSMNNDSDNIIILCPNHHSLVHKLNAKYDKDKKEFVYCDGTKDKIKLNLHLNI